MGTKRNNDIMAIRRYAVTFSCSLTAAVFLLLSCAKEILPVSAGVWRGDEFINEWSNIRFSLPESFRIATDEEYLQLSGSSDLSAYNKGDGETSSEIYSLCDLMVVSKGVNDDGGYQANLRIVYESGFGYKKGRGREENYFNGVAEIYADAGHILEDVSISPVSVDGEEYYRGSWYMPKSEQYMDWYIRGDETTGAVIYLQLIYANTDVAKEAANDVLTALSTTR
jgi:hypothetical protein